MLKYLDRAGRARPEVESTAIWSDAAVWVPWALCQAYGDERGARAAVRLHGRARAPRAVAALADRPLGHRLPVRRLARPGRAAGGPGAGQGRQGRRRHRLRLPVGDHRRPRRPRSSAGTRSTPEFAELAAGLRAAFNEHYVDRTAASTSDCTTVYALAIAFGLLDAADESSAGDRLAELVAEAGYRISTGFAGTPFITDALTKTGHLDDAYRLLLERECPSWLYPVTMGATTVWERWDSMLPDGTINPGEMTCFNHYALGAVADWMHRVVGGIAPLAPGYAKVLVAPQPGGGLTEAETSLETPHGQVAVHWTVSGDQFTVEVDLPAGIDGVLRLPGQDDRPLEAGHVSVTVPLPPPVGAEPLATNPGLTATTPKSNERT